MKSMVVDDEGMGRGLLALMLGKYGRCDQASSGKEALELVREALEANEPYDLVCLDVCMPGMPGLETLRVLRELELTSGHRPAKVILVSAGRFTESEEAKFIESGGWYFLTKPFNKTVLDRLLAESKLV